MATVSGKQVLDTQRFRRDGYVVLPGFFRRSDVTRVLEDVQSVFALQIEHLRLGNCTLMGGMVRLFRDYPTVFSNCGKTAQHSINLWRLSLQERIVKLLHEAGLRYPVICTRPVVYFNHPSLATSRIYHTVDAHQDWRSMQGSSNAAVLWLPLVDCSVELGALQVLPGSHRAGLRTASIEKGFGMVSLNDDEEAGMVSLEAKRGDAVLFHSMLIHRSGDNVTDQPRWSAHFRYNDLEDEGFLQRGYVHPYIYKPVEELL